MIKAKFRSSNWASDAFVKRLVRKQAEIDKEIEYGCTDRRKRIQRTYERQEAATALAQRAWGVQSRNAPASGGKGERDWYTSAEWEDFCHERNERKYGYCGYRR